MNHYFLSIIVGICLCVVACERQAQEQPPQPIKKVELPNVETCIQADNVYMASGLNKKAIDELHKKGVKTIVNLLDEKEFKWDEKAYVESLGIKYVHYPMNMKNRDYKDMETLLQNLDGNDPVVVHCSGANRASAVWAMHQARMKNRNLDETLNRLKQVIHLKPEAESYAREYVEKGKKR